MSSDQSLDEVTGLTAAFTRAVLSAQIVPPIPSSAPFRAQWSRASALAVRRILDVGTLNDLAVRGQEGSTDSEIGVLRICKLLCYKTVFRLASI